MSLNVYDVAKHHIGLGPSGSVKGFMLVGAYSKEMQREALGAQDFGGSTDLIGQTPSLARWTQDDFTGGGYQEDWTKDDAMFSSCASMMSEGQSRALITTPPFSKIKAVDLGTIASPYAPNPLTPIEAVRVGGYVFYAFQTGIYRYKLSDNTGSWHQIGSDWGTGAIPGFTVVLGIRWEASQEKLYVLVGQDPQGDGGGVSPEIWRIRTDFSTPSHNHFWDGPDGEANESAFGFTLSEGGIVLAVGSKLYLGQEPVKPNNKDGKVKWTLIDRLPGRWRDSTSYAGRTYILVSDNHKTTSLVAFDGSAIEPIANFPWNFDGVCIEEYAGRLYVGGHGTDINGGPNSAELYEVTGASVRLVRSFAPYAAKQSSVVPTKIDSMVVDEGLLWFNCKGIGIIGYDVTSDGIFGGPLYQQGANFDMFCMMGGYGRLWGWGHDTGSPSTKDGIYRVAQTGDTVSAYTPELITSDFSYEPAVKKRLSQLRVMTRYKACTADISTDSGQTWTALTGSETVSGYIHLNTFDLSAVSPTEHWRFKITIPMGTDIDGVGELIAYTCSFAFLDTGKQAWAVAINGADEIEGRDGASVMQDVGLTATTIWGWAMNRTPLVFTDVDGQNHNVHLTGLRENQPIIGPNIPGANRPEAFYAVTLLEV